MSRDSRYDLLFQPVQIGPVTAKNRFYQVPHCTGMGYERPETLAAMRAAKAEGGWGVVCTEYASIDPSSDDTPYPSCTLWDEDDVRTMAVIAEAIHELALGLLPELLLQTRQVTADSDVFFVIVDHLHPKTQVVRQ